MVQPLWKTVWWFFTKLNTLLPYGPAIVLLGVFIQRSWKTTSTKTHKQTNNPNKTKQPCTWMFIAGLIVIAKTRKPTRCPSPGEWTHTNDGTSRQWILFSNKKKWASNPLKDMDLKCILLRSWCEKAIQYTPSTWYSKKAKLWRQYNPQESRKSRHQFLLE